MIRVVIVQTSPEGALLARREFVGLNLIEGKDFQIFNQPSIAEQVIVPEERQLFITGSFRGSTLGIAGFVQKLRDKNPQLVCMSYASFPIDGPFDLDVTKSVRDGLKSAVMGFLDGSINRRPQ